jgi:paraquat-inducible protein B
MSDHPQDHPEIPQAIAVPKRRWAISLVWFIPIIAALLGAWVAVQQITSKGPTITITFKSAEGLEAGKTKVRYKDVDIGTVQNISIARDRTHVIVSAEMSKEAKGLIVDDTRFWVVRPRVTLNSVTGLGTLLSGAFIGVDAGKSEESRTDFAGLDTPPPVTSDSPGRRFVLRAEDVGSLYVGAPVYYRRVQVGSVTSYTLDEDGKGVTVEVFVNEPNDRFVTTNTRFWQASGIDVSLEGSGFKLNTESLISVFVGGIAFQAPQESPSGEAAMANAGFDLYANKEEAMKRTGEEVQTYLLYFTESLRGLAPGAPVDFRGIVIGEVKAISVEYDRESKTLRFPVEIEIYPERMRSRYRPGAPQLSAMEREPHALFDRLVKRGFRAQLKTANLLTGQMLVALDFFPNAARAQVDWEKSPPVLPTMPGAFEDLQETLANIARKLDKVPFDTIGSNLDKSLVTLRATLDSADKLVRQIDGSVLPEMKETLEQARKTLGNAERSLASDAPVQQDLRDTLNEVSRAARSVRDLTDYLNRHPEALLRGKKEDEK